MSTEQNILRENKSIIATTEAVIEKSPFRYAVDPGYAYPIGATLDEYGVNFSVFARRATSVELLLFDKDDEKHPIQVIQLDSKKHRTFHFWHVYVHGIGSGIRYAYRVDGPDDIHTKGSYFNRNKVLIDPYAKGILHTGWSRPDACTPHDNLMTSMRGVVVGTERYDWEGDQPLMRPLNETIIYEMHARGFTRSPSSNSRNPGTFSAIIEKIPYLQELGITAIELLPIFDFDHEEVRHLGLEGKGLTNYWGYDPISFFAPQSYYCVSPEVEDHFTEFRDMIKALHKAGIEVILDVVFNHTTEGNHRGPIINFKGLANECYYMLSPQDKQYYMDYSGCGNTINGNHPITAKLISDAIQFWVREMHVDGFRFDEASILARNENGQPMLYPPIVWEIELSDILANTKVIAEPWDAGGLNELGFFPGYRWSIWNGSYRDTIRRFVRGDQGSIEARAMVGKVAQVISGSADIFEVSDKLPINSVNFITAHDGFTMNDLVSYNYKHNEMNGEGNQDGINENFSWNCGVEGETDDPGVEALRNRQLKNLVAILLLSQGIPMFVAGDEVRHTQKGNNNAYCQDNEMTWFDWALVEKHAELFRFFKYMIAFRKDHPILHRSTFFSSGMNKRGLPEVTWHGCQLNSPGWDNPASRALAFTLGSFEDESERNDEDIHVMFNMEWEALNFEIPYLVERNWYKMIDTAQCYPHDVIEPGKEAAIQQHTCCVEKHSVVVLVSR